MTKTEALREAWEFCDAEHGFDSPCERCESLANAFLRVATVKDPPWTPFQEGAYTKADAKVMKNAGHDSVWLNSRYQVAVRAHPITPFGRVMQLSIKRLDRKPIHDWRELQRIKNEMCGTDCEAVEIYPAENRLVDTSNQFWLWVFEPGRRFPIGLSGRLVSEKPGLKAVQRPFDPDVRPADLRDIRSVPADAAASAHTADEVEKTIPLDTEPIPPGPTQPSPVLPRALAQKTISGDPIGTDGLTDSERDNFRRARAEHFNDIANGRDEE